MPWVRVETHFFCGDHCVQDYGEIHCPKIAHNEEARLKRCHHCGEKFGLIRRSHALKQFCSSKCVDRHLKELEGKVIAVRKLWLAYLATGHDTAASDAPGSGTTS